MQPNDGRDEPRNDGWSTPTTSDPAGSGGGAAPGAGDWQSRLGGQSQPTGQYGQQGEPTSQYGQPTGGAPYAQSQPSGQYGQSESTSQYGQPTGGASYGQSQPTSQYGQGDYGQSQPTTQYGQPGYGQPGSATPGYGQGEYGQSQPTTQYGQSSYGQNEYGQTDYGSGATSVMNYGQPGQYGAPGAYGTTGQPGAPAKKGHLGRWLGIAGAVVVIAVVAILLFVAPGFAVKKVFDPSAVARTIESQSQNGNGDYTAVQCPSNEKVAKGTTFTCSAADSKQVTVTVTSGGGDYTWAPAG